MESDDHTRRLLEEIRDVQREHLAEYRRVTAQLLELQQRATARQEQARKAYKRIVGLGSILVAALFCLLLYLLVRWSNYLFR